MCNHVQFMNIRCYTLSKKIRLIANWSDLVVELGETVCLKHVVYMIYYICKTYCWWDRFIRSRVTPFMSITYLGICPLSCDTEGMGVSTIFNDWSSYVLSCCWSFTITPLASFQVHPYSIEVWLCAYNYVFLLTLVNVTVVSFVIWEFSIRVSIMTVSGNPYQSWH